jgi:hypothetical protein
LTLLANENLQTSLAEAQRLCDKFNESELLSLSSIDITRYFESALRFIEGLRYDYTTGFATSIHFVKIARQNLNGFLWPVLAR